MAEGGLWDKMHDILKRKIKEGVEVKFLYDDFGAAIRTRKYFKQILEHEGFEVRVFNPIMKYTSQLYMNFRSHQKIMVIDGNRKPCARRCWLGTDGRVFADVGGEQSRQGACGLS